MENRKILLIPLLSLCFLNKVRLIPTNETDCFTYACSFTMPNEFSTLLMKTPY